jgi:hypothetical protein
MRAQGIGRHLPGDREVAALSTLVAQAPVRPTKDRFTE